MNGTDLISMIGNLSRSLFPVQALLAGVSYLIGAVLFIVALTKLKRIAGHSVGSPSQERGFVPIAYLLGSSALFFLPSAVQSFSNTVFGQGNILQYSNYNPYDIQSSMGLVIRIAGLIWFIRGCILLVHASEPGVQHGPKGLAFLCAGILAINFQNTTNFVSWIMRQISTLTMTAPGAS